MLLEDLIKNTFRLVAEDKEEPEAKPNDWDIGGGSPEEFRKRHPKPPEDIQHDEFEKGALKGAMDAEQHKEAQPGVWNPSPDRELSPDAQLGYHFGYRKVHSGTDFGDFQVPEPDSKEYPEMNGEEFLKLRDLHNAQKNFLALKGNTEAPPEAISQAEGELNGLRASVANDLMKRVAHGKLNSKRPIDSRKLFAAMDKGTLRQKGAFKGMPSTQWSRIADIGAENLFGPHDAESQGKMPPEDVNAIAGKIKTRGARAGQEANREQRVFQKGGSLSGNPEADMDVSTGGKLARGTFSKHGQMDDPDAPEPKEFENPEEEPGESSNTGPETDVAATDKGDALPSNIHSLADLHHAMSQDPYVERAVREAILAKKHPETGQELLGHLVSAAHQRKIGPKKADPANENAHVAHHTGKIVNLQPKFATDPTELGEIGRASFFDDKGNFHLSNSHLPLEKRGERAKVLDAIAAKSPSISHMKKDARNNKITATSKGILNFITHEPEIAAYAEDPDKKHIYNELVRLSSPKESFAAPRFDSKSNELRNQSIRETMRHKHHNILATTPEFDPQHPEYQQHLGRKGEHETEFRKYAGADTPLPKFGDQPIDIDSLRKQRAAELAKKKLELRAGPIKSAEVTPHVKQEPIAISSTKAPEPVVKASASNPRDLEDLKTYFNVYGTPGEAHPDPNHWRHKEWHSKKDQWHKLTGGQPIPGQPEPAPSPNLHGLPVETESLAVRVFGKSLTEVFRVISRIDTILKEHA